MKSVLIAVLGVALVCSGGVASGRSSPGPAKDPSLSGAPAFLPVKPPAPTMRPDDCHDAAKRKTIMAALESGDEHPLAYQRALSRHYETLMTRKLDSLARAAKWSGERTTEFALGMFEEPALASAMKGTTERLKPLLAAVDAIIDEPNQAKQCRILVGMFERVSSDPNLEADAEAQWRATEAVIDAEAARLGLKLD